MEIQFPHLFTIPSTAEWWRLLYVFCGLLGTIALGEGVRTLFKWSPEFTRKLVHISVGILIFFAPLIFTVALPAIILAIFFIAVNFVAIRKGLLKGMHGTGRATYGTVFYPLSFLILVLIFWYRAPLILSLSILVLALADAGAAIVGESYRSPTEYRLTSDKKSVEGSMTMFIITFVTVYAGLQQFGLQEHRQYEFAFLVSGITALTATAWEAISARGLDNLTVPLVTAFLLAIFVLPSMQVDLRQYALGTSLAIVIAVVSHYVRFLSLSGSVAVFLLASPVFGIGGWKWTIPILAFFVLSSVLSKLGKRRKGEFSDIFEKGSTRDYAQVLANGGIPGALLVCSVFFRGFDFYPFYVAAIAAVTADTWGTEIGLMRKNKTYLITTFRETAAGVNGGVSYLGILGSAFGSGIVTLVALPWLAGWQVALTIIGAGIVASLVDSLLGATVQATFRCPSCGKETEKRIHCAGAPEVPPVAGNIVGGFRWMNNDVVNFLCSASGSILMFLFML
ncbi:MAG: DUF92 domain-containing protein [Ignavibacteria bacterium]|nr:DUF92 domain-containing protein [Ignavibacteria bacterium]